MNWKLWNQVYTYCYICVFFGQTTFIWAAPMKDMCTCDEDHISSYIFLYSLLIEFVSLKSKNIITLSKQVILQHQNKN